MRRCSLIPGILFAFAALAALPGCGSGNAPTTSIESDGGDSSGSAGRTEAEREREARRQADLFPVVEFTTTAGTFKVKLDRAKAEKTVHNFLEYVASGFYQGTVFHQVDKEFVIAGGGYTEVSRATDPATRSEFIAMQPKATRVPIRNEAHNGRKNVRGTVAMVRSPDAADSATSQFLINLADNPSLDHKSRDMPENGPDQYGYCVFGEVVEGSEVIESIASTPVQSTVVKVERMQPKKRPKPGEASEETPAVIVDDVTFDALPRQPIVIQAARRVQ